MEYCTQPNFHVTLISCQFHLNSHEIKVIFFTWFSRITWIHTNFTWHFSCEINVYFWLFPIKVCYYVDQILENMVPVVFFILVPGWPHPYHYQNWILSNCLCVFLWTFNKLVFFCFNLFDIKVKRFQIYLVPLCKNAHHVMRSAPITFYVMKW